MSSLVKKQPDEVVARVLKRSEVGKIARRLQSRLALAQFKTQLGWEDLTLDSIELLLEEMGRKRVWDVLSDSSLSVSDLCPTRTPMSSPHKSSRLRDAASSSNWSIGRRKRTTSMSSECTTPCPRVQDCVSLTAHKSWTGRGTWQDGHQRAQSSPIKPRRLPWFATTVGRDASSFRQRRTADHIRSPNFAPLSHDDDDLPVRSPRTNNMRPSPPRTPPMQPRCMSNRTSMERLSMPPHTSCLPSTVTTPGEGSLHPNTPGQSFDLAEFVHITPSPAQKQSRTSGHGIARMLTFVDQSLS